MQDKKPRISFFGLGYVGIVTAACFASKGFKVLAYDIDESKVNLLNEGKTIIYEPCLDDLVRYSVKNGFLKASVDPNEVVLNSEITFITVGTPSKQDGSIDLRFVKDAANLIGKALKSKNSWHLVVVKSTVLPGTTNNVVKVTIEEISGRKGEYDFGLCSNPEFLREGSAVQDMLYPDRLIIGGSKKSTDYLLNFYKMFYEKLPETIITSAENAELIKYANNAFLAMKVSFINMIARICQKLPSSDVEIVAKGIGLDKRIGPLFLKAGVGWGGSCWPKDLNALKRFAEEIKVDVPLINATIKVNEEQPLIAIEYAKEMLGNLKDRKISILGLSFKPNTDDIREAVSIKIINKLLDEGALVVVYDPKAMEGIRRIFGNKLVYAKDAIDCIKNSECAILVTEWEEFKKLKPEDFLNNMKYPALIDGRRVYNPEIYSSKLNFRAVGLGYRN
jgi:nucleotide sugar dehydrogenase